MLLQILAPLALPCLSSYLRRRIDRLSSSQDPTDSPRIQRLQRLLQLTQNQAVQALPEIWFTWWLIGGSRMLDVGKWLTGMDYVSSVESDVLAACLEPTSLILSPPDLLTTATSSWSTCATHLRTCRLPDPPAADR
jgi:hypothetical protein